MADTKNTLPEGTDTIIEAGGTGGIGGGGGRSGTAGSAATTSTGTNATGGQTRTTDSSYATDALITGSGGTGSTGSNSTDNSSDSGSSSRGGVRGLVSSATGKIRDEGKTRVHGFATQGLERSSTTLTNISTLIDDTVQQIEDRLGPQYGDYARKASQTLNRYATSLQDKNPDELVDDARQLIRKSPAIALTGAAIIGFGIARLLKVGLEESDNGSSNRNGNRTGSSR